MAGEAEVNQVIVHSGGALVGEVLDLVARWPQLEEMKRAGCYPRADSAAGSVLCSVPSAVRELFQRFQGRGATRQAADEG